MTLNRDNFTKTTVDILAKRVGYICSNPTCKNNTVGPHTVADKFTIVGVAAHITAASPGGPRYDSTMTTEQRKDINNGIWLCSNCSTIIDKDPQSFPIQLLHEWKEKAENEMNLKLRGIITQTNQKPALEADLIWSNSQRLNRGFSYKNKELYGDFITFGVNKPIIYWNLQWNFTIAIYNNSSYPAFNIKIEKISGHNLSTIDELPKINNLPPYADLKLNARFEDNLEGTSDEANKLIKPKVPEVIQGLQFKLTYFDENKREFTTIVTVKGEELINEIK